MLVPIMFEKLEHLRSELVLSHLSELTLFLRARSARSARSGQALIGRFPGRGWLDFE